jgi:hypothetical protein
MVQTTAKRTASVLKTPHEERVINTSPDILTNETCGASTGET